MSDHCHHEHDDQHCHEELSSCCSHDHHHCHCHCHQHESFADQLIHIADDAWMEVLKDKMKKQIEAHSGERLDQLAKLVTEQNESRWHHKTSSTYEAQEFKDKIAAFFKK